MNEQQRFTPLSQAAEKMRRYSDTLPDADDIWLMEEAIVYAGSTATAHIKATQFMIEDYKQYKIYTDPEVIVAALGLVSALQERQGIVIGQMNEILQKRPGLFVVNRGDDFDVVNEVSLKERMPGLLVRTDDQATSFYESKAWYIDGTRHSKEERLVMKIAQKTDPV